MFRPASKEPPSRLLFGSFVAVVASFVAATAFTHYAARQIDAASDAVAYDSAPSIEHLAAARLDVTELDYLLNAKLGFIADTTAPANRDIIAEVEALNSEVQKYLQLPLSPAEEPIWDEMKRSAVELRPAVDHVIALADSGTLGAARSSYRGELRPILARMHRAIMRGIELNAQAGRDMAMRIKEVRSRAARLGYTLDALCVLIAALAGLIVRRQMRTRAGLLAAQSLMAEARASELEAFAGRVAHDIVNPIAAAQTAVELARRHSSSEHRERDLERAHRSLRRAAAIVDGLLRFARAGAKPEPGAVSDVRKVVEDVTAGAGPEAEEAGAEIEVDVEPCSVACNQGVLTSVVSNLLLNALKYIGEGPLRRIWVRARSLGDKVRIEVEDSGPGLPRELVDQVFQPYVRGESPGKPGLGLGLATVKRIADGHGGSAGVQSAPGRGSLFWVELPSAPAEDLNRTERSVMLS